MVEYTNDVKVQARDKRSSRQSVAAVAGPLLEGIGLGAKDRAEVVNGGEEGREWEES